MNGSTLVALTVGRKPMYAVRYITLACLLAAAPSWARAQSLDPNVGTCLHKSGDESIVACTAVIGSGLHSGKILSLAFYNRAFAYFEHKDYVRAMADFNKAILLDPKNADAYVGRGTGYLLQNNNVAAIADFSKVILLDPKSEVAFNNRGYSYLEQKDYGRAITDYSDAIRLNPQNAKAFFARGLAKSKLGHPVDAKADMDHALILDPKVAEGFKSWMH